MAIATGELVKLIPELIEALGGEAEAGQKPQEQIAATLNSIAAASTPTPHILGDRPDPMYQQAVDTVRKHNRASISLVQRVLRVGYNRTAQLLDDMEKAGVVSKMTATGSHDVSAH